MKKFFLLSIALLFAFSAAKSQTPFEQEFSTPYYLDAERFDNPPDRIDCRRFKSYDPPAYLMKNKPAKERILTDQGFELVNVSNGNHHQSETWIAINPADPSKLIAASNDYRYNNPNSGYRMPAYFSNDGGQTWVTRTFPGNLGIWIDMPTGGGCTIVDPGVDFDSEGNAVYVYLFAQLPGEDIGKNGVFTFTTSDQGQTWYGLDEGVPASVVLTPGSTNQPLNDKCLMTVDNNPNSDYTDRVYVAWYLSDYPDGGIAFAYSEDGMYFEDKVYVQGTYQKNIQSPQPFVGPNGELYIVWEEKGTGGEITKIQIQKSIDGGENWAWNSPKQVMSAYTCGNIADYRRALTDKQNMRISSHPSAAVNPNNGDIYVAQAGKDQNGLYGIWVAKSVDGGETWGDPIRVDDNELRNDMVMPAITVDPVTEMVSVFYYSSQNDPENVGFDGYLAISNDGGQTYTNVRVTPYTWYFDDGNDVIFAGGENLGYYWGDYTSIDSYDGRIYPCFWMPSGPRENAYSVDVYVALMSPAPKAPTNAETAFGEDPTTMTLTWTDPTHNQLNMPLDDFVIYVYKDDQLLGEVAKGVQTYEISDVDPCAQYNVSLRTVVKNGENTMESPLVRLTGLPGGDTEPKAPEFDMWEPLTDGVKFKWTNPAEHVDGTPCSDLVRIEFFKDDEIDPFHTVVQTGEQAGQAAEEVVLMENGFYFVTMKAVTERCGEETPSVATEKFVVYSGDPVENLDENFDDPDNMIDFISTEGWGLTQQAAKSAPNSINDSPNEDYSGKSNNFLYLQPALVPNDALSLSMDHIGLIRKGAVGVLSFSEDFGKTWKDVMWVDEDLSDKFGTSIDNSEWIELSRDVTPYQGKTLFIRFALIADAVLTRDGWFIDDLKFGQSVNGIAELSEIAENSRVQVSPNPVTGTAAKIEAYVPVPAPVRISVVDVFGREKDVIFEGTKEAGKFEFDLNLSDYPGGVYFVEQEVAGVSTTFSFSVAR